MSRDKRLTTLHANFELEGLIVDWHLGEFDFPVVPIVGDQPVYAYA
tara:strand:+ start:3194 stop:3331 length:138 start_codon:yes stop_codon:yes gene_type:complete